MNGTDYSKRTALHWASQEGYIEAAQILIQNGAILDALDKDNQTPLYIATAENHFELANLLIKSGANVNFEKDTTPFMIACALGYYDEIQILLEADSDIDHRDEDGRTALFYAKVRRDAKMMTFLLLHGASEKVVDKFGISIADLGIEAIRRKLYNELY